MDPILTSLESSGFAAAMRSSLILYPLANVVHVLAALAFFASVAAMDFRLLRAGSISDAKHSIARIRPVAVAALLVQVGSGFSLFAPEATHIWHNPVFRLKLLLIAVAFANVIAVEILLRRSGDAAASTGAAVRGAAAASLALWLSVAAAGRLIAYF